MPSLACSAMHTPELAWQLMEVTRSPPDRCGINYPVLAFVVKPIKKLHRLAPFFIVTASLFILCRAPILAVPVHELVWAFGSPPRHPSAGLVPGPDGYFWGTTEDGG